MKYFIIAGEKSGDQHGANLIEKIKKYDLTAKIYGMGGDEMQKASDDQCLHIRDTNFMGIKEVILNLPKIKKNFDIVKESIASIDPDVIVFIDYPGFNLRMAKWCKKQGYLTAYYIPPKVWAWNEKRVKKLKKYIDRLFVIFPFEKEYFRGHGLRASYVGNPTYEVIKKHKIKDPIVCDNPILAIFPGSRNQEVRKMMPVLQKTMKRLEPKYHIVIAGVSTVNKNLYPQNRTIIWDDSFRLLAQADRAIVKSGTTALEAALFKLPHIVVYKTSYFNYLIARLFIRISYISLPNILLDKLAVPELIQHEMSTKNIVRHIGIMEKHPEAQIMDFEDLIDALSDESQITNIGMEICDMARRTVKARK